MANYGALTAKIYNQALALQATYTDVVSARGTSFLNRVGNGEITLKVRNPMTGITEGNLVACYINDTIAGGNVIVCGFTIEEIHKKTSRDGASEWRIAGRDLLGELSGYPHFVDIGAHYETTTVTNASIGETEFEPDAIGTVETALFTSAGAGHGPASNPLDVDDSSGFSTGDPIVVQLDADSKQKSHLSTVVSTTSGSPDTITIEDALPSNAAANNLVTLPEAFLGDSIGITQDDAVVHYSRITEQPGPERLKIKIGLRDDATSPKDIVVISSQNYTTDDIYWIMKLATDDNWTLDSSAAGTPAAGSDLGGTADGTGHSVDGASIMKLLINASDLTTEWFRWERTSADTIERTLAWRASSDSSGITISMPTTQAGAITDYADTSKAILHDLNAETRYRPATGIVAQGATDDFHIADKTDPDTVGFTNSVYGGRWLTENDALSGTYTYIHYVTFNGIEPETSSTASKQKAANELYRQSVLYLQNNDSAEKFKRLREVIHGDILPGQSVVLSYTVDSPGWTESVTVYVSEITHSVGRNGVRYTDLLVSEDAPYNRETAETKLSKASTAGGAVSSGGSAGGPGGGETHPPVFIASSEPSGAASIDAGTQGFTLSLSAGDGLSYAGTTVSLDAPGTLTTSSSNAVTADSHTHAVTTTSDARGTPSTIIAGDSDGRIRLDGLRLGNVSSASDHLVLDTAVDAQGEGYTAAGASAFTSEWKIDTGLGAAYFAYIEADQMNIRLLQADVTMAKANGMIATDSVGVLSSDLTIPSVSGTTTMYVEDNPALGTAGVFQDGDWVRMRYFERDIGLSLYDVWGQVTSYSDQGDGTQSWTYTHREPSGIDTETIQAGAPVLGYGVSGQGWWEVDARRNEGPFTRIGTWAGANPYTAANRSINLMTGRLLSLTGNDEYGFFAGQSGINGPHVLITDRTIEFQDVDISMREGTADGGYISICAVELNSDVETAVFPTSDGEISNITRNSGTSNYYTYVDESPTGGTPCTTYIYNTDETASFARFNMADISHTITTLEIEAYITTSSFTDDTCQLRAQMVKNDGVTALTDEVKLANESTSDGVVTVQFTGVDTTASDAEWAAAQLLLTWIYFVKGSTEVITIDVNHGINITGFSTSIYPDDGGDFVAAEYQANALTFGDIDRPNAAIYTGADLTVTNSPLHVRAFPEETFGNAEVWIEAITETDGQYGRLIVGEDSINLWIDDTSSLEATDTKLSTAGGFYAGDVDGSPNAGQLVLDQGTLDTAILTARSDDVTGMTTQGMDHDNTYFQLQKTSVDSGGARLRGGGESSWALWLTGSANTGDATETTSSYGPVLLQGKVDDSGVGSGNNVVVMRDDSTSRWILKDTGEVYNDYATTMTTYDDYDDDGLVLAMNHAAAAQDIPNDFGRFVRYNRDDLVRLKLVSAGGMINTSRWQMLHNGTLVQHGEKLNDMARRLARLEAKWND